MVKVLCQDERIFCMRFCNFLGFQIFSTQHKVCVTVDSSDVTVARCDTGNVDQRWTWINHDQLLHKSTGRCLAVGELDIVFS